MHFLAHAPSRAPCGSSGFEHSYRETGQADPEFPATWSNKMFNLHFPTVAVHVQINPHENI